MASSIDVVPRPRRAPPVLVLHAVHPRLHPHQHPPRGTLPRLWLCLASVMAFRQLPATLHGLDDALSMDLASTALPVLHTLAPSADAAAAAAAILREALSVCTAGKAALFQNLAALVHWQAFPIASVTDVLARPRHRHGDDGGRHCNQVERGCVTQFS